MKLRYWLLPALTVVAVLFAISLPETLMLRWDQHHMGVLYQESVDDEELVTDYSLSGSERLHLLRYSGIQASGGTILYGTSGSGISVDVRTLSDEKSAAETDAETANGSMELALLQKNNNVTEHLYNYFYEALYLLVDYGVIDNDLLLHYQKTASSVSADYCTVTDNNDPFSSMSLLCVRCTLEDAEVFGLSADTSFSLILDEEMGVVYGLSVVGDPGFVLADDPLRFSVLADFLGVSFTEYEEMQTYASEELPTYDRTYPSARFNFGGYSYLLEQTVREDGKGVLEFNPEKNLNQDTAS